MRIDWIIEKEEMLRIKKFVELSKNHPLVKRRIQKNVDIDYVLDVGRERIWFVMLTCLLSTQQRSGANSPLYKFCSQKPFNLNFQECLLNSHNLGSFVEETLTGFGGIRRAHTIGSQAEKNFRWVNEDWDKTKEVADELLLLRRYIPNVEHIQIERNSAHFIQDNFFGFGPKQSRNFWQTLGLFRFEIPIDSRITKWLNKNGFPVELSASSLSNINYYEFIMTGIQEICLKCDVLPCIFDAAVFASYEENWPKDEDVW